MVSSLGPTFSFSFSLFLFLLSLLLPGPVGCTVLPSNNSADLSRTHNIRFRLESGPRINVTLAPLTEGLVHLSHSDLAAFNLNGSLVDVDATNSLSLEGSDIAFISCDDSSYPGNLDASQTVDNVLTAQLAPLAIILYSTTTQHCDYTSDSDISPFRYIFTLLNRTSARNIEAQLNSEHHNPTAQIMSFVSTASPSTSDGGNDTPTDNPNTAAAMIILYSITGIITALFLGIIVTGAVRAHRHPERYGPRHAPGRTRQSRAKGIARAMVEAIPIVKFGDTNDGRQDGTSPGAAKDDVELGVDPEDRAGQLTADAETGSSAGEEELKGPNTEIHDANPARAPGIGTKSESSDASNFSCPICTDDFIKGQDIRVLPCNHKFHPDCIDPWLLNVSGTCPLCRIDLHPEQDEENEGEGDETETPQDGQGESTADGQTTRQHRRITAYLHDTLNAHRMRDASVEERLAVLRRVREANRGETETGGEEGNRRRSRLTARLRDRFRVRTRAHQEQGEGADSAESAE